MNLDEARSSVGSVVETDHAGYKLIRSITWHGPYILKQVTKGGLCILEGYEEFRVPPSQIRPYDWTNSMVYKLVQQHRSMYDWSQESIDIMVKCIQDEIDRTAIEILLGHPYATR